MWNHHEPHVSKAKLRQVRQLLDLDDGVVQGGLQTLGHHVGQNYCHHHGQDVGDLPSQLKADNRSGHCVSHRTSQRCCSCQEEKIRQNACFHTLHHANCKSWFREINNWYKMTVQEDARRQRASIKLHWQKCRKHYTDMGLPYFTFEDRDNLFFPCHVSLWWMSKSHMFKSWLKHLNVILEKLFFFTRNMLKNVCFCGEGRRAEQRQRGLVRTKLTLAYCKLYTVALIKNLSTAHILFLFPHH